MNPWLGWALAALFVALAWQGYGWQGLLFALSAIVFWLLLQFNRSVRVMKNASHAPVGHVGSAVMLNARLRPGMTLLQVIALTKSLGRKLDAAGEAWAWEDESGSRVELHFVGGKLTRFTLVRPDPPEPPPPDA
ncbi:MAG: hypothetical protein KIT35_13275 [Piscinibacter sp.]|uniref:hypothetical protein n=1 Tax=Piscinibacter sp. TaxID=1903157 RepID=UPI0025888130|nr:hypothetical protein [Piscinibacter sp.]MCW5664801.1 hypothetical protein [Piscinibacter sp.]